MLLEFARTGAESDGEAEDGTSMRGTAGNSFRGGSGGGDSGGIGREEPKSARAPSKVMAKAQQLYDEHAANELRKEQRRKVSPAVAAHRDRGYFLVCPNSAVVCKQTGGGRLGGRYCLRQRRG